MCAPSQVKCVLSAAILSMVFCGSVQSQQHHTTHDNSYAGQQTRQIKSLSSEDIEALKQGSGWGLAKSAELNGVPGPLHLLELQDEIRLSAEQRQAIEVLFKEMRAQAITLGEQLIDQESDLDRLFRERPLSKNAIEKQVEAIGVTRAALRLVHLAAHLETPAILTPKQLETYNTLRGYGDDDPCENVPAGHNETMWKLHNNCN